MNEFRIVGTLKKTKNKTYIIYNETNIPLVFPESFPIDVFASGDLIAVKGIILMDKKIILKVEKACIISPHKKG